MSAKTQSISNSFSNILGSLFQRNPPSEMDVFLDGYTALVPKGFAENIIAALGGWHSFTTAAVIIQKDNNDLSIVDRFIDDKSTVDLFNESLNDIESFMYGYYQLEGIDIPKPSDIYTQDNDITFGQLNDALSNGLRFTYYKHAISTEILIARFVIHSAMQILCREYDLYRCVH